MALTCTVTHLFSFFLKDNLFPVVFCYKQCYSEQPIAKNGDPFLKLS